MQGKIIKGIAGFYYIYSEEDGQIYECRARGVFRKDKITPLVGDNVLLDVIEAPKPTGNITKILPRKNDLLRPAVANVDQAMIMFAVVRPDPNYNLLDRFLVLMEQQKIPCLICFNKSDIATSGEREELRKSYEACGFTVLFVSAQEQDGMEDARLLLRGKTTVTAGPSGVGKSTMINYFCPDAHMEVGEISAKIQKGRHTTRHSEIFALGENTYLVDTPGFTSLLLPKIEKEELKGFYPEFIPFAGNCKFRECVHINEPVCGVKEALKQEKISELRYRNYQVLYEELKAAKKY